MINPDQIRSRLLAECPRGTRNGRLQEIANDLGISAQVISDHRAGRKISKYALAMYNYYFAYLDLSEKLSKDGK